MATLEQIAEALRRADAAGNANDARALAKAYREMQGQSGPLHTVGKPGGMSAPGNLDLNARKVYHGTSRDTPFNDFRTERSMSIGTDAGEVLIPTVVNGRQLSEDEAIAHYNQTGENLGTFATPDAANQYADALHQRQGAHYGPRQAPGPGIQLQGKVTPQGSTGEVSQNVQGLDAQGGYDFALDRVNRNQFPGADRAKLAAQYAPYDSMKLLQAGGTLGLSDEAAGAAGALGTFLSGGDAGQAFTDFSQLERARADLGREQQGALGTAAEVAGSIFSGRPDMAASKVAGVIPQMVQAGKASVLPGVIQGAASEDGGLVDRIRSGALGGAIGGVVGAGVGGVAAKLGEGATKVAQGFSNGKAVKNAPVIDDIRTAATNLFTSSKASGTAFTPQKFTQFASGLVQKARGKSIDPDLDGEALLIYRRMAELANKGNQSGQGVSLAELHNLRQKAQDVALTAEKPRTKGFAQDIVDGLDDLLTHPKPADIIGGPQAANDLLEGIGLWSRAKKMALLEEVITKAQYQKSGFENGLRSGFLGLLRNPKTRKLFTPAEIAEIERVGKGTLPANLLNLAGKFGFSNSGNALGGFLGGMGAFAASGGNPFITAAAALGASASRKGAEKLTQSAAERAVKAVATANLPSIAQKLLPPAVAPSLLTGGQTYLNR